MRKLRMLAAGAALALLVSACQPGGSVSQARVPDRPRHPRNSPPPSSAPPTSTKLRWWPRSTRRRSKAAGFTVERNLCTGPRETTLPALESGELNLMPEYIGSLLSVGFEGTATGDPAETFAALRRSCRRGPRRVRLRPRERTRTRSP